VQDCFGSGILMFADALFLGGLSLIKMAKMDLLLTVLSLIPMGFMLTIVIIVGKYMSKKWEKRQEAFSSLSDFSQESFSGIAVIKAFVKEFKELMAFKKLNKENEHANVEYTKASTLLRIFVTLFVESVICVILGYGGFLVYKGTFNAGELMEFIGYFNSIVWPVMAISELIELQSRGKASLKRISELLDAKQDVIDAPDAKPIPKTAGNIEFKNLTFKYPDGDYNVLTDINVKINAGEHVGIIGKTGSGKTTLVDLILRNYNVEDGTLFIDGYDVNEVTIHSLRENTAYVPQDNFLFSDTIQNNIAFASDTNDLDSVKQFAGLAAVADNIEEFNDGYISSTMLENFFQCPYFNW
jgi:ATP-binding cassette subfamily B protein